ncbi:MAG TPA: molybdopterin dinucleotide binding domain-containing protein, partial [Syntrophales bacterium]|nr:molybdopterin dinucleotide binding domain-containing protein [Syntrophales bacterium]
FRKAILEDKPYPIRGAYMMCCNPMLSYADSRLTYEAFMKLDFLAVAEIFMTPTAALADVVLPAATQFEFNDIGHIGIGHGYILARPKVVEPPEECWPDIKIMNELGKRMTPKELWKEDFNEFAEDVVRPAGLTYAQFCEKGYLKGPERFKKYEEKGFSTPTTRVELRLSTAEKFKVSPLPVYKGLPEAEDPAYPLVLTSAKSRYYLHSSYRWVEKLRKLNPDPRLEIHPETAGKYGIAEGDNVLLETPYGKITQRAYFSDALDPRVLCAAHGWWFPEGDPETQYDWQSANFNMLTSVAKLGKEYGTPNLKGLPCKVSKA